MKALADAVIALARIDQAAGDARWDPRGPAQRGEHDRGLGAIADPALDRLQRREMAGEVDLAQIGPRAFHQQLHLARWLKLRNRHRPGDGAQPRDDRFAARRSAVARRHRLAASRRQTGAAIRADVERPRSPGRTADPLLAGLRQREFEAVAEGEAVADMALQRRRGHPVGRAHHRIGEGADRGGCGLQRRLAVGRCGW